MQSTKMVSHGDYIVAHFQTWNSVWRMKSMRSWSRNFKQRDLGLILIRLISSLDNVFNPHVNYWCHRAVFDATFMLPRTYCTWFRRFHVQPGRRRWLLGPTGSFLPFSLPVGAQNEGKHMILRTDRQLFALISACRSGRGGEVVGKAVKWWGARERKEKNCIFA